MDESSAGGSDRVKSYMTIKIRAWLFAFGIACLGQTVAFGESTNSEYVLGPADVVHITDFNNPELTTDVRVPETGSITFPLIGDVRVVGLTIAQAQAAIAQLLTEGHFVVKPQVNILPISMIGSEVTVVGHVNHPGRYPLLTVDTHVSDALAAAGGVDPMGADTIILIQHRDGKEVRKQLEVTELFVKGSQSDERVGAGDTIYLPRQAQFFIYGEVHAPGAFRLERHMTVMQGLALGGFERDRGSERRTEIYRQDESGTVRLVDLKLTDPLQPNDVIYVRDRLL